MRFLLLLLMSVYALNAGTYDYAYSALENKNTEENKNLDTFMYQDFQEIIRFDMLWFKSHKLKEEKKDGMNITNFEYIVKTIKTYINEGKNIKIKIIGHTSKISDNHNELIAASDTYASSIQNTFSYDLDTKSSEKLSKDFAYDVQKRFIDNKIDKSLTIVEYRGGKNNTFTNATRQGRDLSNRVMVTMYVLNEEPIKSNNDIDSDKDGIYDSLDKCSDTIKGLKVDVNGCPKMLTLTLNFKTNSDIIFKESMHKVAKFAKFLIENPLYDAEIIGHTDSANTLIHNKLLSQRRALSTKNALIKEGVKSIRLTTKGEGELKPIKTNDTEEGKQANRRIEVILSIR